MLEMLMSYVAVPVSNDPLVAGTNMKGWYGEVLASNFITGNALADAFGLTDGTAYNSDAGWLKFSLNYKTLYIAKKPFRYGISWDQINAVNLVYGNRAIVINGLTYKVRLIEGRGDALTDSTPDSYDSRPTWNSEWNRTLYHVSGTPFNSQYNSLASEGISNGNWAQYSEADLLTYYSYDYGSYCWCQEPSGTNYLVRGANGVSFITSAISSTNTPDYGWRPCLELIG